MLNPWVTGISLETGSLPLGSGCMHHSCASAVLVLASGKGFIEVSDSIKVSCTPVLALGVEGGMCHTICPVWLGEQGAAGARNV